MSSVLVVAAHPDDEILGAGATLAKHVDQGDEVQAVIVSEGATSRYQHDKIEELKQASRKSADIIGLTSVRFLGLPDQRLDTVPLVEINQMLAAIISEIRPEVIYTHIPVDVNTDHGIVARATWTAARPYVAPFVRRIMAFETPSSTEWAWPLVASAFQPQVLVDVTATLERKLQAMDCYASELRDYPHPRSRRALKERSATWGSTVGVMAAEPFVLLRSLE